MSESPPGVLITRPLPAAVETARRVTALGLAPVLAPFLAIVPRRPHLPPPDRVQALLVTSANALPALSAAYHRLPLLAVGDATAARARAAGFTAVASAAGDAAALAALAGERCDPAGGPLLLASGARQGLALAAALRARGFVVQRRIAYAALPVATLDDAARAALHSGRVAAALFFSPATARAFVAAVRTTVAGDVWGGIEALAISAATRAPLTPLRWRSIRVASRPTQEELLALLT